MPRLLSSLLMFLILMTGSAAAQDHSAGPLAPNPALTAADMRESLSLDGVWTWSVDPYRDGVFGFHGAPAGPAYRRYEDRDSIAASELEPSLLIEYDMRRERMTTLPGSWINHDSTLRHYVGLMWYRRAFELERAPRGRAFLRFGAANYKADVFLNGERVGSHEGGFTPFAIEVTGKLRRGENSLVVGVDSARDAASVPPPVTDWETYGGVTRGVALIVTPETFIDDAWVRLTRNGEIAASIHLDGPRAAGETVRIRIPSLDFELSGAADESGLFEARAAAPKGFSRWSPEAPVLYDVEIQTPRDRLTDRVGFRTVEVRGEDILLNGEPIFLRGICLHEEELGVDPNRSMTEAAARALLTEVKEGLNGNFVRLAHYPHSEVMTRLADEMGLLVWSEIPVYWRIAFDNPETLTLARRMLAENIVRDRNRASVVLWSLANETPAGDARNAFLTTLAADVRALDDTRLVTAALLSNRDGRTMTIDDPLVEALDVMAVNTYNGWYSGDPLETLPDFVWRSDWNKPLIFSEFGAGAKAGFRDPALRRKFSEEYQAEYFRRTLEMAEKIPFLRGLAPWILKDFRSPRRQHPVWQQGWNRKGVISETGARKEAFGVLADHYRRRAEEEGRPD